MRIVDELIKKYKIESETLLKVIQHPNSTEDEVLRASIAWRFTTSFIRDLKEIKQQD